MSLEYPDWVNPWKAAEGRRRFAGSISLTKMDRLIPLLEQAEGLAEFEALFFRDSLGLAVIDLRVQARLPLRCQATLERFFEEIERQNQLAVTREDETDFDDVPEHYDVTGTQDGKLSFLQLVQDELILSVPQVPRKPGLGQVRFSTDPDDSAESADEEQNKPFAALAEMMQGKQD